MVKVNIMKDRGRTISKTDYLKVNDPIEVDNTYYPRTDCREIRYPNLYFSDTSRMVDPNWNRTSYYIDLDLKPLVI